MGWCSGTEIFDKFVELLLDNNMKQEQKLEKFIDIMWDHDWDCESDSEYWDHPTVRSVFKKMKPDWFEDE